MAIKDLYKKEKDNLVKMDIQDFIDEHKELVKVLKEGSRDELLAMAEEQEEELEETMKEFGITEEED